MDNKAYYHLCPVLWCYRPVLMDHNYYDQCRTTTVLFPGAGLYQVT